MAYAMMSEDVRQRPPYGFNWEGLPLDLVTVEEGGNLDAEALEKETEEER
jgi:hypothetical protein